MRNEPEQVNFDDLSAFLDGELPAAHAAEVARLVETAPAWGEAARQVKALDAALGTYDAPAAPQDLAAKIVARAAETHRRGAALKFVRYAAAAAAAAAAVLVLAVVLHLNGGGPENRPPVAVNSPPAQNDVVDVVLKDVPTKDQFAVENLDIIRDYQVLANFETIQAVEKLENASRGT